LFVALEIVNSRLEAIQKQKSSSRWLAAGDMNTKFFQMTTRWRSVQNMINSKWVVWGPYLSKEPS